MENLIEIQDVVKRFGEQTVLDHVSLSVTPGKYMESSEGTEAARQFFLKASVVLSCRMRGKSWFVANRWGRMWISHRELELLLNIRVFCGIIQAFRT